MDAMLGDKLVAIILKFSVDHMQPGDFEIMVGRDSVELLKSLLKVKK